MVPVEAGADAVLAKIVDDLKTAQSAVDKVTKVDQAKKDDAKAKEDAKTDAEAKAKADAEAKVARWTCEYCGSSNPHDATSCSSCGAPRSEKKAEDEK
ncbi:MAG: hypothetical protein H6712_20125 [Myxococcales bacterium]|nr:hypothetical protein [Myxococcales bacterium]